MFLMVGSIVHNDYSPFDVALFQSVNQLLHPIHKVIMIEHSMIVLGVLLRTILLSS